MTPDQLDSLKWVQDCGGSMRAVNNPLATWLISQGFVSKSLGVISITPKGLGELTPATTAAFTIHRWEFDNDDWDWGDKSVPLEKWFLSQFTSGARFPLKITKTPLIQITTTKAGPILRQDMLRAGNRLYGLVPSYKMYAGYEFSLLRKTVFPPNARTQMQSNNKPLICVRDHSKVFAERISGDIDLILTETRDTRTVTAHIWT